MPGQSSIPSWVIPLISATLGFISALAIERFKNRSILLRYRKNIFQLATSTQHKLWGNIEVFYNTRKTNHLSLITYEIKNTSNIDLDKVNVDFWVDESSQILAHQCNYVESGNFIPPEDQYSRLYQEVIDLYNSNPYINSEDYKQKSRFVLTNRKFTLPVFNRSTSTIFQLLIENFQGSIPQTTISVLHKSCKLLPEEEEVEQKQKKNNQIAIIWMIVFTATAGILFYEFKDTWIIWTALISFVTVFISPSIRNLIGILKRLMS